MFDEETFDALRALHVAFEEGEASLQVVEQQLPLNPPRHLCIKEVLMVGVALVIVYASISLIRKKRRSSISRHPFRIRRKPINEIV